ncbi:hypothetical protein DYB32_000456 [Aphanomyces invadans]|uniref:Fanconi-associated nuclease n=1 Tax=Aphanomyces invadans TaxID=157072 RepID=A0A418B9Y7_9STRA|nr:hypothetical protein DYB32_000456 [Aphanomyces invadans]
MQLGDYEEIRAGIHEHDAIDTFLALPPVAQLVYARLFQRKGPWFRLSSLNVIAERLDPNPDLSEPSIQIAIRALECAKFIRPCPKDSYVDALDAMKCACTIPEIQLVMVAIGASKSKSDVRYKTKLHAVVNSPARSSERHSPPLTLFQIHPETRDTFYRMHQLMYMTLSVPPSQKPAKFAAWSDWQCSATQYNPTAWPGLLVRFGKLATFQPVKFARTCTIFPNMAALVTFECAAMLRHAMTLVVEGVGLDELVPHGQAELSLEWLDIRPPSVLAFALDDAPFHKLACYASVHVGTFLSTVPNLDAFVSEIRTCLATAIRSSRAHDRVFLEPYHATYGLARCLDKAIALYEKLGQYDKALILLQELLATQVLRHKR